MIVVVTISFLLKHVHIRYGIDLYVSPYHLKENAFF